MPTPDKLHGLLGMARRAGKLAMGFDAGLAAVKDGKSELLLLASDASPKTEKECRFTADSFGAQVIVLPLDKSALAAVIGMAKPVAVTAICDSGFAKAIRSYCTET